MKIYIDCENATTIQVDDFDKMVDVLKQQSAEDMLEASSKRRPYLGSTFTVTIETDN